MRAPRGVRGDRDLHHGRRAPRDSAASVAETVTSPPASIGALRGAGELDERLRERVHLVRGRARRRPRRRWSPRPTRARSRARRPAMPSLPVVAVSVAACVAVTLIEPPASTRRVADPRLRVGRRLRAVERARDQRIADQRVERVEQDVRRLPADRVEGDDRAEGLVEALDLRRRRRVERRRVLGVDRRCPAGASTDGASIQACALESTTFVTMTAPKPAHVCTRLSSNAVSDADSSAETETSPPAVTGVAVIDARTSLRRSLWSTRPK